MQPALVAMDAEKVSAVSSRKLAAAFSIGVHAVPWLCELLSVDDVSLFHTLRGSTRPSMIVGWGQKENTARARAYAEKHGLPFYSLEDGFLRSVGLGRQGHHSLSLVVDSVGIYYNARMPSALENILNGDDTPFTPDVMQTASKAMTLIVEHHISKYNNAPDTPANRFKSGIRNVLVVDQAAGDLSLTYGLPENLDLREVIKAAKAENPNAQIHVKLHPETIAGLRKGLFHEFRRDQTIRFIDQNLHPISVLKQMDKVYVATSLLGFEALILGKKVICFGMPFYAGWGLTDDRTVCDRRQRRRSVGEVFAAAYILYSRYVNPLTGKRCGILEALDYLILATRFERLNQSDVYCFGIRHWTRCNVLPYLKSTTNHIFFVKTIAEARKRGLREGSQLVVWGGRDPDGLDELVQETGKPLWRMEDGFLRSVGLGSDLVRPSSLVLDNRGIYYDPARPSDLEHIFNTTDFTPVLLNQAARVRKRIVEARMSKYNTEPHAELMWQTAAGRKVILVPGQVADDASIKLGCDYPRTNLELLREVRARESAAFIVYRPHPDVISGNRRGAVKAADALHYCDLIAAGASIDSNLRSADELHTMTSLCGFDALLRGKKVVTYGRPFYAGWGLTEDQLAIPRRARRLTIDELVAGAMLIYPRYHDWEQGCWTDCEGALINLIEQRKWAERARGLRRLRSTYLVRQLRKLRLVIWGLASAG